jgi:hypothetical protein
MPATFFDADAPVWAAWVQAVGSIAAIFAASAIATRQIRHAAAIEDRRSSEQEIRRLEAIRSLFSAAYVVCRRLDETLAGDEWTMPRPDCSPATLSRCGAALQRLDIFQVPCSELLVFVADAPEVLEGLARNWARMIAGERPPSTGHGAIVGEVKGALELFSKAIEICVLETEKRQSAI